jgi:hypothetical protein
MRQFETEKKHSPCPFGLTMTSTTDQPAPMSDPPAPSSRGSRALRILLVLVALARRASRRVGGIPALLSEEEPGDLGSLAIAGGFRHLSTEHEPLLTLPFVAPAFLPVSTWSRMIG